MAKEFHQIQQEAIQKLEPREASLLVGPLLSVMSETSSAAPDHPGSRYLTEILDRYNEMFSQFGKPLMKEDAYGNRLSDMEFAAYVRDKMDIDNAWLGPEWGK